MNQNAKVTIHNSCKNCEIVVNGDKISPKGHATKAVPFVATIDNPDNDNKKIVVTTEVEHNKSSTCIIHGISPKNFKMEFKPSLSPPNEENDTVTVADDEQSDEEG